MDELLKQQAQINAEVFQKPWVYGDGTGSSNRLGLPTLDQNRWQRTLKKLKSILNHRLF